MPSIEAMEAAAGVGAVIIFLGAVVFALKRLGILRMPAAAPPAAPERRDEVWTATRVAEADKLAARVAEIEALVPRPEALSRIHSRLDDMTKSVGRVEGVLEQVNRQVHLINDHLLQRPPRT